MRADRGTNRPRGALRRPEVREVRDAPGAQRLHGIGQSLSVRHAAPAFVRTFDVVIEKDEDGWLVGSVVQLPGCLSQARSLDELMANMKEAIQAHLGGEEPVGVHEFVGIQRVEV